MALSKPITSKLKERSRTFHDEWEMHYCFTESKALKPICLICSTTIAVAKKYNLERHFKQNHSSINKNYPEGSSLRTEFIKKKKKEIFGQQNLFVKKFWKLVLKEDFPATCDLALQISSRFGSTYICEKAFYTLSYVKNKYRSSLTAPHISDLMLLSTSDLSPDIEKLLANKSLHRSH